VQNFVDTFDIEFLVLRDPSGIAYETYRPPAGACISPFPLDFIIDQDGIIRYWNCEYDATAMVAVIEDLLGLGTGIADPGAGPGSAATRLRLEPAWPNPFNPMTRIAYELPYAAAVRLTIHDPGGRLVRTLDAGRRSAGRHVLLWDGRDDRGRGMPSGTYLYRISGGGDTTARKLTLVR
jgi:hypothetical protein